MHIMHMLKSHTGKYGQSTRLGKYRLCIAMKCTYYSAIQCISPQDGLCVLDGMPEGRDLTFCDRVPMTTLLSNRCSQKVLQSLLYHVVADQESSM